ncbi:hypothetical protein ACWDKQ_07375 [Saccharopolyspora sp. NPDC000995]
MPTGGRSGEIDALRGLALGGILLLNIPPIVPLQRVVDYQVLAWPLPVLQEQDPPEVTIAWLPRRPAFRRRTTCTQSDRRVRHEFEEVMLAA